jgi:hypothetical protein
VGLAISTYCMSMKVNTEQSSQASVYRPFSIFLGRHVRQRRAEDYVIGGVSDTGADRPVGGIPDIPRTG